MCRTKVLVVLNIHLICATSLKVDFGTDNQQRVKDLPKHLSWSVLTKLCSSCFYFYKNNSSWTRFGLLFYKNPLNLFIPLKQNRVRILYPDTEATIQRRFEGMTDMGNSGVFIKWSAMKINFKMYFYLNYTLAHHCECFPGTLPNNYSANTGGRSSAVSASFPLCL